MAEWDDKTTFIRSFSSKRMLDDRYRIDKRIGIGGMSEVYLGHDTKLNRKVAVKVMLPEFATDPMFANRFLSEAQAAAQLKSPHIVSVYDMGEHNGQQYIVMEYVQGVNLKQAFRQKRRLGPKTTATIALQVCQGLREAHALNIIHRDIKSSNIMVQKTQDTGLTAALGESLNVKIMDFGIAQAGNAGKNGDDEAVLGSAHYISPEQIEGISATPASDLYSLGIVMYEACTGKLPFDGDSTEEIVDKQLQEAPIPPRHLNPVVDDDLNSIIMKAMAKSPGNRYTDALAMQQALSSYLATSAHNASPLAYPQFWVVGFTKAPDGIMGTMRKIDKPTVLGRDKASDIAIPEESVSRSHMRLTPMGLYLEVEDLDSSNGTCIDGNPIKRATLCKVGATIEMGNVHLRIGSKA